MKAPAMIMLLALAAAGCASRPVTEPGPEILAVPVVEVETTHTLAGYVRIDWRVRGGQGLGFDVQRRHATQPWKHRAALSPNDSGRMTLEDTAVTPGEPYSYRVRVVGREDLEYSGTITIVVPRLER